MTAILLIVITASICVIVWFLIQHSLKAERNIEQNGRSRCCCNKS